MSLAIWVSSISVPLGGAVVDRTRRPDLTIVLGCLLTAFAIVAIPLLGVPVVWLLLSGVVVGLAPGAANLRRVPHEHGMTEPLQEGVEPDRIPGALNADRHGSWQGGIEVLDGRALMRQLLLEDLAGGGVEHCHLLLPRVQIASHECHGFGLLSVDAVDCAEGSNSAEGPFS